MEYKNPMIVIARDGDNTVAELLDGDAVTMLMTDDAVVRSASVSNIVPAFGTEPLDFEDLAGAALDELLWGHRPRAENTQGLVVGDIVRVTKSGQAFDAGEIGQVQGVNEAAGLVAVTAPLRTLVEPFLVTQLLRLDQVEKIDIE